MLWISNDFFNSQRHHRNEMKKKKPQEFKNHFFSYFEKNHYGDRDRIFFIKYPCFGFLKHAFQCLPKNVYNGGAFSFSENKFRQLPKLYNVSLWSSSKYEYSRISQSIGVKVQNFVERLFFVKINVKKFPGVKKMFRVHQT